MIIAMLQSRRLARRLGGRTDFVPEDRLAVHWNHLPLAKQRKPGLQTAEYTWFTSGATGFKLANLPFGDIRVRRARSRGRKPPPAFPAPPLPPGAWAPHPPRPPPSPACAVPLQQRGARGRRAGGAH